MFSYRALLVALWVAIVIARPLSAQVALKPLAPDEIALVVNQHVKEGRALAEHYALARGIPDNRIIELDLPTIEDMPFDRYDRSVAPVVRKALIDRGLREKVRCLVTFFGVPLRIVDRSNGLPDSSELGRLKETVKFVTVRLVATIGDVEKEALVYDSNFRPASNDNSFDWLVRRLDYAGRSLAISQQNAADPELRRKINEMALRISKQLTATVELEGRLPLAVIPATAPSTTMPVEELIERPYDRIARSDLREQMRRSGGILGYLKTLNNQIEYLTPDASGAALDSELALLWWPPYARTRWQPNTLNPHYREMRGPAPVMMVMRLDAPSPQLVRNLIANSIATEREGLQGKIVIDARGIPPKDAAGKDDGMGMFDARLRVLASMIQSKTQLPLKLDDNPQVLPANSVDDVALYCGWYSLRNYVPSMKLNRGAIGYHVASFELMTLHSPLETGWVHGLMMNGITGTIGPVAEPYLHSFPLPEEFFPLLLTGKLPLAQVYWSTTPLASWMQVCIGDPLYNPYAKSPMFKTEDLPEILKPISPP